MTRLGALSDEMTPVLSDLGDVAPDINRFLLELGPFSQAATPALDSLGEASKIGTPAVRNSVPVVRDLRTLAKAARPVGEKLAEVLVSFRENNGIERAMDYIFFQAAAVNGFDSFGHYLRAGLIVNQCSTYAVDPVGGCSANFRSTAAASASRGRFDAARPGARLDCEDAAGDPVRAAPAGARGPRAQRRAAAAAPSAPARDARRRAGRRGPAACRCSTTCSGARADARARRASPATPC